VVKAEHRVAPGSLAELHLVGFGEGLEMCLCELTGHLRMTVLVDVTFDCSGFRLAGERRLIYVQSRGEVLRVDWIVDHSFLLVIGLSHLSLLVILSQWCIHHCGTVSHAVF